MLKKIKHTIKKFLSSLGFLHPALGEKMDLTGKVSLVLKYKAPHLHTFVETGTEFGAMLKKVGDQFTKVYSIELDKKLHESAKELFKQSPHITFLEGDSGIVLEKVVAELSEPALFWLDAHGPGPMTIKSPVHCPVEKELGFIFKHPIRTHVILIDDARHFDIESISTIKNMALTQGYTFKIEKGVFVLTPGV